MAVGAAAQWRTSSTAGAALVTGGVLRLIGGKWVLDTASSAADAYVVVAGGKPVADDAAVSGLRLVKAPFHIYAY